jgi:isopentenyldiphosphate isomerase
MNLIMYSLQLPTRKPEINPLEVNNWRYISVENLKQEMKELPDQFTVWFKIAITGS